MFEKFVKTFVKDSDNVTDNTVRENYGKLVSITCIILNVILCVLKIGAGLLTGAISIVSDGVNNLSDAGSSVITLIGFKLSSKKPDKDHPFGHGRMEYFAGLAVSVIILIVAFELLTTSITKIIEKETLVFDNMPILIATIVILCISIFTKTMMALLNDTLGKKINSCAMEATAKDSLSDVISTAVVLICTVLAIFIKTLPIDGFAGIVVSVFIGVTGVKSVKDILDILLGQAPDTDFVKQVGNFVLHFDKNVIGIHDLIIHDYGPGRKIITLHVEVPSKGDIMELHDMIDNIERSLEDKFNTLATIHMDPVETNSQRINDVKAELKKIIDAIDDKFTFHDLRMNEGETHANVLFDLVITHETHLTENEISDTIKQKLKEYDKKLNAIIKIEYSFV